MWKENEHPRDEDGKFTDKNSNSTSKSKYYRQNASYGEILVQDKNRIPQATKFNRLKTKHHIAHALEMGYKSMKDYEVAAINFFNSDKGKLFYSEARDRYYRYDEKLNLFVAASDGIIHTFKNVSKKEFNRKIKQDKLYEK